MRRLSIVAATLALTVAALVTVAARQDGRTREFAIVGNNFSYNPPTIEVNRDDLVKITFTASDIPHSFTIDDYRIAKRAGIGQTVTFEFRADHAGTFPYYCNLTQDERCKNMKGRLVVH